MLNIFEFIEQNNFDIKLGPWFNEIWIPLFNETELLITLNILNFIHYGTSNVVLDYHPMRNNTNLKRDFEKILNNNKINYKKIKYNDIINNEDYYNKVKEEIENIRPCNLEKSTWFILSVDEFKMLIMRLSTNVAIEVREYFILLEKILFKYSNYTNKYLIEESIKQIKQKDEQLKILQSSNNVLNNFVNNIKQKNKKGYIYIATSKNYAKLNTFKIGKTDNLISKRQSQLNNSHTSFDKIYICYYEAVYNPNKVEQIIHDVLESFRDSSNNEFFILHYKYLLNIVKLIIKNINEPYDNINDIIKNELIKMYDLKPFIPEELIITSESILLNELKDKIFALLDEYIESNNLNITRSELLRKLDICSCNKLTLWKHISKILNWEKSNKPINYKNTQIIIRY
ncbi:ORF MSV198 MTG motif gene family protein [Melanoplus sanguinipes entomopoxvirus]|uniref:ORF MSV198 MTG motif gene family protein n=1 Tax=Melanoplus sanguinipes entomopoxvirus TaxID=83191 RepID=Q9YVP4_MSEPV|nr:ORF MSV198 MTG motif gene family protein [Melanoplus sanguinipes entomopoxvirus]AAC97761.1 ORF MSV198 MTG motif gene family protein [Melanoplus sanguinipes entomopoxvirus 'O']